MQPLIQVRSSQCKTCIYRPDSVLDLKKLEREIADHRMKGHFRTFRICHHAARKSTVCCWGFWHAHKNHFDLGQLAQRLKAVQEV